MKNELPHLVKPLSHVDRASHHFGVILSIPDSSPRLNDCLTALAAAVAKAVERGHQAELYVVIDGRSADSGAIASTFPVHLVTADFPDLASARAIGARAALAAGATWLAFTDSNALVAESWLLEQISNQAELLIGGVEITNRFMAEAAEEQRSGWHDADPMQPTAAHFSNLGMSRSAFELAANIGGQQLRLDAALLDHLTTLEIATHRCSKPLVYARTQAVEEIVTSTDLCLEAARSSALGGFDARLMSNMSPAAAVRVAAAPLHAS